MRDNLKCFKNSRVAMAETVDKMLSSDYKERLAGEYQQTAIRYFALKKMLREWRKGELNFIPATPRYVLKKQLKTMGKYLKILEARAYIEDIDLYFKNINSGSDIDE